VLEGGGSEAESTLVVDTLYATDIFRLDHLRVAGRRVDRLACSFTAWGEQRLDGPGFGGSFLLAQGYDVLAFKMVRNNWYQVLPRELFDRIGAWLQPYAYRRRVGYGASMGGYAAIQFSGLLELNQVLALSPQYRIDEAFDTTWAPWARDLEFHYRIEPECLAPGCRYLIVYDSKDEDQLHVERIAQVIPAERLSLVPLPHAGHPVVTYLAEAGLLKEVSARGLDTGDLGGMDLLGRRRQSSTHLWALSMAALRRGHPQLSLAAIERAIAIDPQRPEFLEHRAALKERLGIAERAPGPGTPLPTLAQVAGMLGVDPSAAQGTVAVAWERVLELVRRLVAQVPFDEERYLAANPDVAEAVREGHFASGRQHFIDHGFAEGRDAWVRSP